MGIKLKVVINLATFNLFFNFIFYIFEMLKIKLIKLNMIEELSKLQMWIHEDILDDIKYINDESMRKQAEFDIEKLQEWIEDIKKGNY